MGLRRRGERGRGGGGGQSEGKKRAVPMNTSCSSPDDIGTTPGCKWQGEMVYEARGEGEE